MSTPAFKKRKKLLDDPRASDGYENGEGDIENDPVKKAVSRETLFPEEADLLEPEAEIDVYRDEDEDFQSDDGEIIQDEDDWDNNRSNRDPFEEEE